MNGFCNKITKLNCTRNLSEYFQSDHIQTKTTPRENKERKHADRWRSIGGSTRNKNLILKNDSSAQSFSLLFWFFFFSNFENKNFPLKVKWMASRARHRPKCGQTNGWMDGHKDFLLSTKKWKTKIVSRSMKLCSY